jgi:hypothetical protein
VTVAIAVAALASISVCTSSKGNRTCGPHEIVDSIDTFSDPTMPVAILAAVAITVGKDALLGRVTVCISIRMASAVVVSVGVSENVRSEHVLSITTTVAVAIAPTILPFWTNSSFIVFMSILTLSPFPISIPIH